MEFDVVIGLEVHCQLNTKSKIFAADHNSFGAEPNTHIGVLTLAHPGVLPRTNREVVDSAVKLGLAFGSTINRMNYFDRKNYFYPDLPKGYQVTQDSRPVCVGGSVRFVLKEGRSYREHEVKVHHIHMEEDAGKSVHTAEGTLLDYNRAGAPLLEIVSYPCISSPEEAAGYLAEIRRIVRFLGISDGNMEEGSLRADLNVSLKPKGSEVLGTKVEIKNMNSIRFLQRAAEFEIRRQAGVLQAGGQLIQETRTFIPETGETESMRVKETANDYRYFPEPDLAPVQISEEKLEALKAGIPALPYTLFHTFVSQYGLSEDNAYVLSEEKELSDYFLETIRHTPHCKPVSNWMVSYMRGDMNERSIGINDYPVRPGQLAELVNAIEDGKFSHSVGQKLMVLLAENSGNGGSQANLMALAESKGWVLNQDTSRITEWVEEVLMRNKSKVEEFKKGKKGLLGMFVGEVMKLSGGSADPKEVNKVIMEKLK
ncbi:Asp-tRNA(Asn)/Glu-tRNA(Gln) amidotransferase subunit GatB [Leadbetterella sp. DM7]|uniref:Asp-tRNA(Asn)/Glu-tRNA(Gln) amidotransferase subunit GatB n=1 Tax=Leadbetterella sp. DM7 TaxID=3235085 RepID=UPI00349E6D30